ncbi:hypothetical protein [Bacillus sp. B15-48]|uniref:hypothetical protein n=1 Tax=Bacillus sp. B15-48 TaxID=1548601 RepID=UPI00193ED774|nr:hypothetical protein [Bacillus sp. B15-48]MBM4761198.1 hypothetical protein [Bacillus sp. B15-48]
MKRLFGFRDRKLKNFTLEKIHAKMMEMNFNRGLIIELVDVFKNRINEHGEAAFRKWFSELDYRLPEEFEDESLAIKIYENYSNWIENEVNQLERETKLSWEQQTEDLIELDEKARKVQLVIRNRLSDIALDLY